MRRIGVVTLARSDYSTCLPILRAVEADADLELLLWVTGTHLLPEFGETIAEIEADGFAIHDRIDLPLGRGSAADVAAGVGMATTGFSRSFAQDRPDILFLVGDRLELLGIATAALAHGIPIAHASGGEITEGAIDNQVRHAVSKLSQVHFATAPEHAARLRQMGEESWRVHSTGDPALDLLRELDVMAPAELSASLGIELVAPVIVVTHHPTTITDLAAADEIDAVMAALTDAPGTVIVTHPNADAEHGVIMERIARLVAERPATASFASLGYRRYYSLLSHADLMVGNSSSGIWEAPSFGLPVVNIGDRQRGRLRAANVVDVDVDPSAIAAAIERALDPEFARRLAGITNPYGDGRATERILAVLRDVELGPALLQKRFVDTGCEGDHP